MIQMVLAINLTCSELLKLYEKLEIEIVKLGCLDSNAKFETPKCKYLLRKSDEVIHALETRCMVDTHNPRC